MKQRHKTSLPRSLKRKFLSTPFRFVRFTSLPADLALGPRRDPAHRQVQRNGDDANDPQALVVALAAVHEAEDDGEDDAAEVASRAGDARQDAVGGRVHVRHEGKVGAVAGLEEDCGDGHDADHDADVEPVLLRRVDAPDDDEQRAGEQAAGRDPALLHPQVAPEAVVEQVGDDAAHGPRDEVEEPEDGGVVARLGLVQVREVGLVVGAEDRVDGQLAAKGARVGGDEEERLQREDDAEGVLECGLGHRLAAGGLEGLRGRHLALLEVVVRRLGLFLVRGPFRE